VPRHVVQRLLQYAINVNAIRPSHRKWASRFLVAYGNPECLSTVGRYHSKVFSRPASSRIAGCSDWDILRNVVESRLRDLTDFPELQS
jgi:hypothetical protein